MKTALMSLYWCSYQQYVQSWLIWSWPVFEKYFLTLEQKLAAAQYKELTKLIAAGTALDQHWQLEPA